MISVITIVTIVAMCLARHCCHSYGTLEAVPFRTLASWWSDRAHVYHFIGRSRHCFDEVEVIIVPLAVGFSTDVPWRPIVCQHHSVLLQRLEDHLGLRASVSYAERLLTARKDTAVVDGMTLPFLWQLLLLGRPSECHLGM